jgi:hypothetical protein
MTMLDRILFIVPTRNRPESVVKVIEAFEETNGFEAASLQFAYDDDDDRIEDYRTLARGVTMRPHVSFVEGRRMFLGPTLNERALANVDGYYAIGFMGDDHRPRTNGWSSRYRDELHRMGTGFVYGNDLLQGANLPTHVVITSDIVRQLGWFCPPGLIHMYLDNSWRAMGQAIDRLSYLSDVVVEHMHPIASKAEWDDGYKWANSESMYAADAACFSAYIGGEFEHDMDRLLAMIHGAA